MKIDTHVHSEGISKCSHVTYEEIVRSKKLAGLSGAVLTNHCQPWYYDRRDFKKWINEYLDEFYAAKAYGERENFRFYLGIEVTIIDPFYADFLLFGTDEKFLLNAPDLCRLSQEELYKYCHKNDVLMIQAHPLREKCKFMDVEFMDGVEINLRPSDLDKREKIIEFGKKNNLFITVGSDYHDVSQNIISGGIIIPDEIKTAQELANFIRAEQRITTFINDKTEIFARK